MTGMTGEADERTGSMEPDTVEYACQRCTKCCQWPGFVRLADEEIARISSFLAMDACDFIQQFTQLTPRRSGLALQNKENGHCVFLDGRDCQIQEVKPSQCQGFPNRWRFPGWRDHCEAVPLMPADRKPSHTA